jgi:hypothetical protein
VVTYRDRYRLTTDDPIGPEPTRRDPVRWGAWHRARVVLGVATLTGQVAAATDAELAAMVATQRAADATAPPYVGGALRTAHIHAEAADQQLRDLRRQLATAESGATRATQRVADHRPRWWQVGPWRTRATAHYTAAQQATTRSQTHVADLHGQRDQAVTRLADQRTTVTGLEGQYQTWSRWYDQALPIRYAGLAAAAEQATRLHRAATSVGADVDDLVTAIRESTARVRAVDDTRPRPHSAAVPGGLATAARAGQQRAADLSAPTPVDLTEPDLDDL